MAAASQSPARVAAIVLAAGASRRMGSINKLLVPIDGIAMVRRTVETVLASGPHTVIVVTGNQPEAVRDALADCAVTFVHNPDFQEGIATSVRTGIASVPTDCDGAVVVLADMPHLTNATLSTILNAFDGTSICLPSLNGRRGNPVLWPRACFADMMALTGDVGARQLLARYQSLVRDVAVDDQGTVIDIDRPEDLPGGA